MFASLALLLLLSHIPVLFLLWLAHCYLLRNESLPRNNSLFVFFVFNTVEGENKLVKDWQSLRCQVITSFNGFHDLSQVRSGELHELLDLVISRIRILLSLIEDFLNKLNDSFLFEQLKSGVGRVFNG